MSERDTGLRRFGRPETPDGVGVVAVPHAPSCILPTAASGAYPRSRDCGQPRRRACCHGGQSAPQLARQRRGAARVRFLHHAQRPRLRCESFQQRRRRTRNFQRLAHQHFKCQVSTVLRAAREDGFCLRMPSRAHVRFTLEWHGHFTFSTRCASVRSCPEARRWVSCHHTNTRYPTATSSRPATPAGART